MLRQLCLKCTAVVHSCPGHSFLSKAPGFGQTGSSSARQKPALLTLSPLPPPFPSQETLASPEAQSVVEDNFKEVVAAVLEAYDSGELMTQLKSGHDGYKK